MSGDSDSSDGESNAGLKAFLNELADRLDPENQTEPPEAAELRSRRAELDKELDGYKAEALRLDTDLERIKAEEKAISQGRTAVQNETRRAEKERDEVSAKLGEYSKQKEDAMDAIRLVKELRDKLQKKNAIIDPATEPAATTATSAGDGAVAPAVTPAATPAAMPAMGNVFEPGDASAARAEAQPTDASASKKRAVVAKVINADAITWAAGVVRTRVDKASPEEFVGMALYALARSKMYKYFTADSERAIKSIFKMEGKIRDIWLKPDPDNEHMRIAGDEIKKCLQTKFSIALDSIKSFLGMTQALKRLEDPEMLKEEVLEYNRKYAAVDEEEAQFDDGASASKRKKDVTPSGGTPSRGGKRPCIDIDDSGTSSDEEDRDRNRDHNRNRNRDGRWIMVKDFITNGGIHHNSQSKIATALIAKVVALGCDNSPSEWGAFCTIALLSMGFKTINSYGADALKMEREDGKNLTTKFLEATTKRAEECDFGKEWQIVPKASAEMPGFCDVHFVKRT